MRTDCVTFKCMQDTLTTFSTSINDFCKNDAKKYCKNNAKDVKEKLKSLLANFNKNIKEKYNVDPKTDFAKLDAETND